MRRAISIFLFLSLVGPFTVLYFHFLHEKHLVRKTVKRQIIAGLDRDQLVYLSFSISDTKSKLRWEHSKEFEYQGQMYDIVEKEYKGDSVFYWCWWDHDETALNKQLTALVTKCMQSDPLQQEKHNRLFDFYKSLYLITRPQLLEKSFCRSKTNFHHSALLVTSSTPSPPAPPPWLYT